MICRHRTIRVVLLALAGWSLVSSCGDDKKNPATPTNDPPTACFLSDPSTGTTETVFSFDPSCSVDREDSTGALMVRWDWEGDTNWDTDWRAAQVTTQQYDSEGRKTVRIEVRDTGGLVAGMWDTLDVGHANVAPGACVSVAPDHGTMATVFEVDARILAD